MGVIELAERAPAPTPIDPSGAVTVTADVAEDEWSLYVENHPDATVDHLWGWRGVIERVFGQQCVYQAARRNGVITGVLPLVRFQSRLFGRFLVSLPYLNYGGVLASDPGVAATLIDEAQRLGRACGASHVELRHRLRQAPDLPFRQHKVGMVLPLPATPDDLWKAIDRKVRNQVRKAQKEGLTAESGGVSLVNDFYGVFSKNMRDLGTPVYSRRLFSETLQAFPERARIHIVRHQGRAVAGSVTVRFRDTVLVPWASSLRELRQLCPNMLLYWSMLEQTIQQGGAVFDFGRSSVGSGTYQFKQQWGATEIPQHWEYVLLTRSEPPNQGTDNARFTAAIAAWQRLPLWLANVLGPRIVANIP